MYILVLRSKTIVESDPVLREAETESDCLADRAAALDEQKVWTHKYVDGNISNALDRFNYAQLDSHIINHE